LISTATTAIPPATTHRPATRLSIITSPNALSSPAPESQSTVVIPTTINHNATPQSSITQYIDESFCLKCQERQIGGYLGIISNYVNHKSNQIQAIYPMLSKKQEHIFCQLFYLLAKIQYFMNLQIANAAVADEEKETSVANSSDKASTNEAKEKDSKRSSPLRGISSSSSNSNKLKSSGVSPKKASVNTPVKNTGSSDDSTAAEATGVEGPDINDTKVLSEMSYVTKNIFLLFLFIFEISGEK
jgi:hypothetical protein